MTTILVIEDEPAMRANLADILELEGFETLQAGDGKCGLELATSRRPDLILCDVMMPELDGHGVIEALRNNETTARIPFIFLTARGERQDIRNGMNLGADDYLVKPVPVDELLAAIQSRLERAQQQAGFNASFQSAKPLESLGLSAREAEILLWIAQGKTNFETGTILQISAGTVKKHLEHIYEKLSVEGRNGASLRALEVLSGRR